MATAATTPATSDVLAAAKKAVLEELKSDATLSLKLGAGVAVVSFGLLTTVFATRVAVGAAKGVVEIVKNVRSAPSI